MQVERRIHVGGGMQVDRTCHMGDDLMVANVARVSFDKYHADFEEGDLRIIKYLAKNRHWTPFAHPQIQIRITVPIFVAAQIKRHVIGVVINEVSRRYVKDDPDYFVPVFWREAPGKDMKQGSGGQCSLEVSDEMHAILNRTHMQSLADYRRAIQMGVAPEQARMLLPQTMMTKWISTGSLFFYAHLCGLRLEGHAQYETRLIGQAISAIIAPLFPHSWPALLRAELSKEDYWAEQDRLAKIALPEA